MRDDKNNRNNDLIILLKDEISISESANIENLGTYIWDSKRYKKYGIQSDVQFLSEVYESGNVNYDCFGVYLIEMGDRKFLVSIFRPFELWENDSLIELEENHEL